MDEFRDKTGRPDALWQTYFTYLKVFGWGWYSLSTILDDYSRYIFAWKLCTTMKAGDVTDTLGLALDPSGCDSATVVQKPRLLSDNGSSYVASDLADYLDAKGMDHVRGVPHHPQTQGMILKMREETKRQTFRKRRMQRQNAAAKTETVIKPEPLLRNCLSILKKSDDGHAHANTTLG